MPKATLFLTPESSMDDLPLDVDGNLVVPTEDQLFLIPEGYYPDDFLPAGDGTENNGDLPRFFQIS